MLKITACLLTIFSLTACGNYDDWLTNCGKELVAETWTDGPSDTVILADNVENNSTGIVGGQRLNAHSQLARQVLSIRIFSKESGEGGECSGTLLSPNVVLTAKHCIEGSALERIHVAAGITSPCESNKGKANVRTADLSSLRVLPSPHDGRESDIALFRLSEPFSSDVQPVSLSYTRLTSTDQKVFYAGFGRTTADRQGDAWGYLKVLEFQLQYTSIIHILPGRLLIPEIPNENICSGDSGGPLFLMEKGKIHQIGVVSAGGTQATCLGGSTAVDLKDNHKQLEAFFDEISGGQTNPFTVAMEATKPKPEPATEEPTNETSPEPKPEPIEGSWYDWFWK